MIGSTFKVCTSCPKRKSWSGPEQVCPACGSSEFTWSFKVTLGTKPDGRPNQVKRGGFARKTDAEDALRRLLEEHGQGRRVDPSGLTVAGFLEEWMQARRMTVETTTWDKDEAYIESRIVPRVGDMALQELTAPTLNALYADIRDNGRIRGDGPLAPKTVRDAHKILHRALNDAVRWGYVARNVAEDADPPTAKAVRNARKKAVKAWTDEQVARFAAFLGDHRPDLFPLWLLAVSTGLRRSEVLGLRWEDVDLDRCRLAVRQVLVCVRGGWRFKEAPKSDHGYRTIRFGQRLADVLRRHELEQKRQRRWGEHGWEDHDLVFARPFLGPKGEMPGQPWHPDYVTHALGEAIDASGLPRIRPLQDMRHTHATILLLAGVLTKVVQERLGHHSFAFTSDTYQHLTEGLDERAADRFDDAVFGGDEPAEGAGL